MIQHPHYQDAVLLLAAIHDTLPEIIHNAAQDNEHDYGLQIQRELRVILRFCEALAGRTR